VTKKEKAIVIERACQGCWFVRDGQPPKCREEWPDKPDQWCAPCFAAFLLRASK
jgi:hypothetical protein